MLDRRSVTNDPLHTADDFDDFDDACDLNACDNANVDGS